MPMEKRKWSSRLCGESVAHDTDSPHNLEDMFYVVDYLPWTSQ